ncbi:hypothetical protein Poly41_41420 [Novipirellula artificiosorum]|uniref:Uncharacterized protein n=1 Tax=Novipirellula artificiosorum TaxID=2528016 RepID=A0A5C6DEA6_9BACT|nr:hypothetical protein Poly41_41420 [Novipirellula artificiosorum]
MLGRPRLLRKIRQRGLLVNAELSFMVFLKCCSGIELSFASIEILGPTLQLLNQVLAMSVQPTLMGCRTWLIRLIGLSRLKGLGRLTGLRRFTNKRGGIRGVSFVNTMERIGRGGKSAAVGRFFVGAGRPRFVERIPPRSVTWIHPVLVKRSRLVDSVRTVQGHIMHFKKVECLRFANPRDSNSAMATQSCTPLLFFGFGGQATASI